MVEKWTERAYKAGSEIWRRIHQHPFLKELEAGTLPDEKLRFYFEQNTHYIDAVVKARSLAAGKAPNLAVRDFCLERGPTGKNELQHQLDMLISLGGHPDAEMAPSCHGYTRHLLTIAHSGETVDLLAAFLPCPWSYDEIGTALEGKLRKPLHVEWMQFYWSREHHELCDRHRTFVDELAADLPQRRWEEMLHNYLISLRYEYRFWEMAYTMEQWPSDRLAGVTA